MKAQDMMTTDPACCTPETTAREAALLMREHDCGCIPVVEGTARLHRLTLSAARGIHAPIWCSLLPQGRNATFTGTAELLPVPSPR
jgi:hypothetical protein